MTVIVTDAGFAADTWSGDFDGTVALDLASDVDPASVELTDEITMIRIQFPSFADGRG